MRGELGARTSDNNGNLSVILVLILTSYGQLVRGFVVFFLFFLGLIWRKLGLIGDSCQKSLAFGGSWTRIGR